MSGQSTVDSKYESKSEPFPRCTSCQLRVASKDLDKHFCFFRDKFFGFREYYSKLDSQRKARMRREKKEQAKADERTKKKEWTRNVFFGNVSSNPDKSNV